MVRYVISIPIGRTATSSPKTRPLVLEPIPSAATTRSKRSSMPLSNDTTTSVPVSRKGGDPVPVTVLGLSLAGVDKDPGEVAAEDLDFGGRAFRVGLHGRELGHHLARAADESGSDLARGRIPHRVLQAGAAEDLTSGTPDVDVLPAGPEGGRALHDGGGPAVPVEPERECGPRHTGSGDQNTRTRHGWPLDGCE